MRPDAGQAVQRPVVIAEINIMLISVQCSHYILVVQLYRIHISAIDHHTFHSVSRGVSWSFRECHFHIHAHFEAMYLMPISHASNPRLHAQRTNQAKIKTISTRNG
jgi:hypothetical protein